MLPIASDIAVHNTSDVAASALPDAPTIPDPPPRESQLRILIAAFLRRSARRRIRLANRLDPAPARPGKPLSAW